MSTNFTQKKPRREMNVRCQCFAKPILFIGWDNMPADAKEEFETNGPIPCEGGGLPGEWCAGCRFGKVLEPEEPD